MTTTNDKLTSAILAALPSNGREAVSRVYRELQQDGWRGLGTLSEFEHLASELGFHLYHSRNDRNQATKFISIDAEPAASEPTLSGYAVSFDHPRFIGTRYISRFTERHGGGTGDKSEIKTWKTRAGAEAAAAKLRASAKNVTIVQF